MGDRSATHLPDQQARREAISTSTHAFVWASAGTGKTHTLTLRALYLLLNAPFLSLPANQMGSSLKDVRWLYTASTRTERLKAARAIIHSVIMTTFTRKAAAEMKTRLYRYLDGVASAGSLAELQSEFDEPLFQEIILRVLDNLKSGPSSHAMPLLEDLHQQERFEHLQLGAQALAELAAELQISTIHSLAASALRRHPLEAGIPPGARFAEEDEDDLAGIEDQVVERWWQRVLIDSELQQDLGVILGVVRVAQIRDWLKRVYQHPWIAAKLDSVPFTSSAEAQKLISAGKALVQALSGGGGSKIEARRDELGSILQEIEAGRPRAWMRLCDFLKAAKKDLFSDGDPSKTVSGAIRSLPPEYAQCFQSWMDFYAACVRVCLARDYKQIWESWTRFVTRFAAWAEGASGRELGLVTFDEMIRLAVRLLEDNPHIRQAEQQRLRAVLVDEFQDTDPDQLHLLKALLRREAGWAHEVIGFFVGDPKQSIYRFRGADVPSILDFHHRYEEHTGCRLGCRDFNLRTSFRSLTSLTGFINHFFESELKLTREADRLEAFRSGEQALPEWIFMDSDESGQELTAEKARRQAALETLRIIRHYLKKGEEEEAADYRDILVLVRDSWEIDALLPVLQEAAIPVVSSGAKTFYRHPEVLDVLNLLIALFHPEDRLAVAAVLRSPLVYLSDCHIHALLDEIPPHRLFRSGRPLPDFLSPEPRQRIEKLRKLAAARTRMTLTEWLHQVRLFIPVALYGEPGDREGRPVVRIDRVLEAFRQRMEICVVSPLVWLVEQRERAAESGRWDADPGEDVTVADESVNAVRVMTIHKAKGLQGRFVIVYGWASILQELQGSRGSGQPETIALTREDGKRVCAFALKWGPLTVFSPCYAKAFEEEQRAAQEEAKRLAYVSATRARDRMVLLCARSKWARFSEEINAFLDEAKGRAAASQQQFADLCKGTFRFSCRRASRQPHSKTPPPPLDWHPGDYGKLWSQRYAQLEVLSPLLARPSDPEHQREVEFVEDVHYQRMRRPQTAALAGRCVHAYLEKYLLEDVWDPEKLSNLRSELPELVSDRQAVTLAGVRLSRFYAGELVDESGIPYRERIRRGRVLGREVPVYLMKEGRAWNGVIDLILEEEGVVRAIDFKSSALKDPLPESYVLQQGIYGEALRRAFPDRKVEFEFWWLG